MFKFKPSIFKYAIIVIVLVNLYKRDRFTVEVTQTVLNAVFVGYVAGKTLMLNEVIIRSFNTIWNFGI